MKPALPVHQPDDFSTQEVARMLGMSVRSVQLMVDRGELQAWKTPGGHRRIASTSVVHWRNSRRTAAVNAGSLPHAPGPARPPRPPHLPTRPRVLLIDDSVHFQRLVTMLVQQRFPWVDLHVADDGIAGLALYGEIQPHVLIVDILLPGIDGAALIRSLRSHPKFASSRLVVVTSLDESQRAPYAYALEQVPIIHKPKLIAELPPLLARWLAPEPPPAAAAAP